MIGYILGVAAVLLTVVLVIAYICYRIAFYAPRKELTQTDEIQIPDGEIYEAFREPMEKWAREVRAIPGADSDLL